MDDARGLWLRIETLHAVTYFGDESRRAAHDAGLPGFWRGYFAFRASPMGPVGPGVVEATFFNFAPTFVERWVPEIWGTVSPESMVVTRAAAAAATLSRLVPAIAEIAETAALELEQGAAGCSTGGRPLFAANRRVERPADPVARLWQACTDVREHRGDGHVAAMTATGLTGLEAHVLIALEHGIDPEVLQLPRGWTDDDWSSARDTCRAKGLVDEHGSLSPVGRALRRDVEATTDRLAATAHHPPDPRRSRRRLIGRDPLSQRHGASPASVSGRPARRRPSGPRFARMGPWARAK